MIGANKQEMVVPLEPQKLIAQLLAETRANGGLAPVEVERLEVQLDPLRIQPQ